MTTNSPSTDATPRPWVFQDGIILANGEALKIVGVQTPMVVGPKRLEAIANAAMIVEVVNDHDRLTAENAELRRERDEALARVDKVDTQRAEASVSSCNQRIRALAAEAEKMREALMDATAHLVAAASAYQKYAARHRSVGRATADPMFTTRVADFEKAAKRAQSAIRALPLPSDDGEVR